MDKQNISDILTVDKFFRGSLRYKLRLDEVDLSEAIRNTIKLYKKKSALYPNLYTFLIVGVYNFEISEEIKKSLQKNETVEIVCPECLGEGSYRNKNHGSGGYSNTACPECLGDGYIERMKTEKFLINFNL